MGKLCKQITVLGLLIFLDFTSYVSGQITAEAVYDLLSHSIFQIKNDVENIKRRIENVEEKFQGILTTSSPQLGGSAIKEEETMDLKENMNMQVLAIQKTLTAEKVHLRDSIENFEIKFAEFRSIMQNDMASINTSLEGKSEVMFDIVNNSSIMFANGFAELKSDFKHTTSNISHFIETMEIKTMSNFKDMETRIVANITMKQGATQATLNSLQDNVDSLYSTVFSLSYNQTYNIQPELSLLSSRISSVLSSMASESSSLTSKISSLTDRINEEENRRQAEKVGFTAFLDHRQTLQPNTVLKFNRILFNLGNAYNQHTGKFRAPVTGTYIFSFQMDDWETPQMLLSLQVDGISQVDAVLYPAETKSTMSGNTAILGLTKGQFVWVQIKTEGRLYGDPLFGGTSFAGALLY